MATVYYDEPNPEIYKRTSRPIPQASGPGFGWGGLRDYVNPNSVTTYLPRTQAPQGGGGGIAPAAAPVAPQGGGFDFNGLLEQQRALARSAYDEGLRRAGAAYERAKGIFDEGMGLLGKRKEEFKGLFNEGEDKILNRYEEERGNLQSSAEGAATKSANLLRALGLGGSAAIKSEGKQRQQNAQAFGGLQEQRNENTTANKRSYDDRLTWAAGQESALTRGLSDAAEARRAAEAQQGLVMQGDVAGINNQMGGFLQTILNNQLALQNANKGVGEFTANPYAVNIADLTGALNGNVPMISGNGGSAGNEAANVVDDPRLAALLERQKRAGVYGGGLYA